MNSGVSMGASLNNASKQKLKLLAPREAAEQIIEATEQNKYRVPIGKDAKFLDFLSRLSPQKAATLIAKKLTQN